MGKEIKTRQIKKDIKALDKTAVAAQHIRQVYVHTKDLIAHGNKATYLALSCITAGNKDGCTDGTNFADLSFLYIERKLL